MFPFYTTEEKLRKFMGLNFMNNVPEAFQSYCQAALRGEHQNETCLMHQGSLAYIHEAKISELSPTSLQAVFKSYSGAHLIIAEISKVITFNVYAQ